MLVRRGVAVAPCLFLVGGAGVDGGDIAVIALVLRRQHLVLVANVADLLAQPVAEVRLLRVRDPGPGGRAQHDSEDDRAPRDCKARAWNAGWGERDCALSHAESLAATFGVRAGADYSKRFRVCRPSRPLKKFVGSATPISAQAGVGSCAPRSGISNTFAPVLVASLAWAACAPQLSTPFFIILLAQAHSHSMVPGGFDVMSNTTRFTPFTSLTMRLLMRASTSYGTRAQSAVIASSLVTTLTATTFAYVR